MTITQGAKRGAVFMLIFLILFLALMFVSIVLNSVGISQNSNVFISSTALEIVFPASVIIYLWLYKKMNGRDMIKSLGLSKDKISFYVLGLGVLLFFIISILGIGVGLIQSITGTAINTNVAVEFAGAPLWFYLFASVITPICEEVLFRGFMVPRIGIIVSALIFGLLHFSYNSTFGIEIIAATIFGLLAGYVFKKTGSLYPSILAHILVNTLAVAMLLK